MGVRGLTTLVDSHTMKLFQDVSLQSTKVVIDGFGLLWCILDHIHGADPMSHGGEYALLRSKFQFFFQNLLKCQCSPYVVFDGSFDLDDKKHKTMLERFQGRIVEAKNVLQGGRGLLMPPLALYVMRQVMTEMGVKYAFSQFEADREIAVLANQWCCPVIGKDSDFFVMDILGGYIPLTHLKWKALLKTTSGHFFMSAKLYRVDSFCRFFQVKKEMLPLFASLAGNDYIHASSVNEFLYSHVCQDNGRQSQLKHLLRWLGEEQSRSSALEKVLKHLPDRDTVEGILSSSIGMYKTGSESSGLKNFFDGCSSESDYRSNNQLCTVMGAPAWIAEAHQNGSVSNMCINILSKGYYFSANQVENPKEVSAWMPSKYLFAVISGIVLAGKGKGKTAKQKNCIVYIRNGVGFQRLKVPPVDGVPGFGRLPTLGDIPLLPEAAKRNLFLLILAPSLSSESLSFVLSFPTDFQLALLSTMHCINSPETKMTPHHLMSLLVGWVYLYSQRQQREGCRDSSWRNDRLGTSAGSRIEISVVAANMNHHQGHLRSKRPNPVISHGFSQWQQCLVYALHLNGLLQCPLPPCPDLSILFNGLIMHSLYSALQGAPRRENLQYWVENQLFRAAPEAFKLYLSMHKFVVTQTSHKAQVNMATNKTQSSAGRRPPQQPSLRKQRGQQQRRKPSKQGGCACASTPNESNSDSDSDQEWQQNNRFAALMP